MNPLERLVPALVLTALLAGCLRGASGCESEGPTELRGRTLRILDHGAFDLAFAAAKPVFENRTGAHLVQIKGEDAGGALRRAIDAKGNPVADVLYGVDNALVREGVRAGIFEAYESPAVSRLDPSIRLDDFREGGRLLATPADHGYVSVNYDRRLANQTGADPPRTLADLARAEWARRFVVEDPRLSSPGLGFLVATVATFGEDDDYDYLDYWRDLLRGGVLVVPDWTAAYVLHFTAGYGQGEEGFIGDREIVVSYSTSPAGEAFFAGADQPPSVSLEPAAGVFHQVEAVAILRCTDDLPLAKAFVDFVLGAEFQDQVAATMVVYPAVSNATTPDEFRRFATAPAGLRPAPFTSSQLEAIPRWVDAWTDLYQAERA